MIIKSLPLSYYTIPLNCTHICHRTGEQHKWILTFMHTVCFILNDFHTFFMNFNIIFLHNLSWRHLYFTIIEWSWRYINNYQIWPTLKRCKNISNSIYSIYFSCISSILSQVKSFCQILFMNSITHYLVLEYSDEVLLFLLFPHLQLHPMRKWYSFSCLSEMRYPTQQML